MATNFDLFGFDQSENGGSWINIRAEDGTLYNEFETSFSPGKGYLNAYAETYGNTNFSFDEAFNTGSISAPALAYTNGSAFAGYNLIGNPYPSGIDWNLATRTAFEDDFAYIYNQNKEGGAGYEAIDGSSARPASGFLRKSEPGGQLLFHQ